MKKGKWILGALLALALVVLGGCGKSEETASENKDSKKGESKEVTLKISASSTPHAEILEFIAPKLEQEGVKLDITITQDSIQTNQLTADKELDANFFQHTPYLNQWNKDSNQNLVSVTGVHIEPFGVYSKKLRTLKIYL